MYVCQECHDRDKLWTKCQFGYFYHSEWKYTKCEICGKHPEMAFPHCKCYDTHKKVNKEGRA